jgi:hypothetical protein
MGVDGQHHWHLYPQERDPLPIVQEATWAPETVRTGAKNLTPTGVLSLDRPAPSESPYQLCYSSPQGHICYQGISKFYKTVAFYVSLMNIQHKRQTV